MNDSMLFIIPFVALAGWLLGIFIIEWIGRQKNMASHMRSKQLELERQEEQRQKQVDKEVNDAAVMAQMQDYRRKKFEKLTRKKT